MKYMKEVGFKKKKKKHERKSKKKITLKEKWVCVKS